MLDDKAVAAGQDGVRRLPAPKRRAITGAAVVATFLAAMDITIVSTIMPRVVGTLGGLALYSWVFSAYLLAVAVTGPLYGKLADLFGRRPIFQIGVGLFLLGTLAAGFSQSMVQLIGARVIQGLGAGSMLPVTITIIGDIYDLPERGRMQGLFAATWAVAAVVAPFIGGITVEHLHWRWAFFIKIPVGLFSLIVMQLTLKEQVQRRRPPLDILGAVIFAAAVTALLLAMLLGGGTLAWASPQLVGLLVFAGAGFVLFVRHERRVPEPLIPLEMFRHHVIGGATLGLFILGSLLGAVTSFVPLFIQGVLGESAVRAGLVLMTMSLGWPLASTVGGRLIVPWGIRRLTRLGFGLQSLGVALLLLPPAQTSLSWLVLCMLTVGAGFGFTMPTLTVAVQNSVPWQRRGIATSSINFSRSMGQAIFVAVLGSLLNLQVRQRLGEMAGLLPAAEGDRLGVVNMLLEPGVRAALSAPVLSGLQVALENGLTAVFTLMLIFPLLGFTAVTLLLPKGPGTGNRTDVVAGGETT